MFRMSSSAYVAVAFLVAGCSGGGTESPVIPDNTGAALSNYAEIVHASYVDSLTSAEDLEAKINTFVTTPTEANLTAAKDAWLDSREPYLQTEVYRFYDGPIDDSDGPEGALNAWPMDESYVDYTTDDANSGIVNDDTKDLAKANLATLNDEVVEETESFVQDRDFVSEGYSLELPFPVRPSDEDVAAGVIRSVATRAQKDRAFPYPQPKKIGHVQVTRYGYTADRSFFYMVVFVVIVVLVIVTIAILAN